MIRVLFVDDEPHVLSGIRRMLWGRNPGWELAFVDDGHEALRLLRESRFDVVVSDMRMPGMDGSALFANLLEAHPHTIRIVLSGQADEQTVMRSVNVSHRFLAKPCDRETLEDTIHRITALQHVGMDRSALDWAAGVDALPTLPELYQPVTKELRQERPSIARLGEFISRDAGMSAKILKISNSAYFGRRRDVGTPRGAVEHLGIETIRSLVFEHGVFRQSRDPALRPALIRTSRCAFVLAHVSKAVAQAEELPESDCDIAYFTGLFAHLHELVSLGKTSVVAPEVGPHLLALWNTPQRIVQAMRSPSTTDSGPEEPAVVQLSRAVQSFFESISGLTEPPSADDHLGNSGAILPSKLSGPARKTLQETAHRFDNLLQPDGRPAEIKYRGDHEDQSSLR